MCRGVWCGAFLEISWSDLTKGACCVHTCEEPLDGSEVATVAKFLAEQVSVKKKAVQAV